MTAPSRRPYLIRAIYDWATDNGYTPHMLVAADYPGVVVPREFVQENRITLNISPMAVQTLDLKAEPIWFSARFGGRPFDLQVPTGAVLAVFARENGEGIVFGEVEPTKPGTSPPSPQAPPPTAPKPGGRAHLKLVK
ncbi:MAG: ClpXP protease specificity-enhancing factor [Stenotrophobium sp.]